MVEIVHDNEAVQKIFRILVSKDCAMHIMQKNQIENDMKRSYDEYKF